MNNDYIVPVYTILDDILQIMNYKEDSGVSLIVAEIRPVEVVSTKYVQNHHERSVRLMYRIGSISRLGVSRFNWCLHALKDYLWQLRYLARATSLPLSHTNSSA